MSKFLKVAVTRTQSTELYVEVPDDFVPKSLMAFRYKPEVVRIVEQTTDGYDWDTDPLDSTLEVQGVIAVSEEEAADYTVATLRVQAVAAPAADPESPVDTGDS